MEATMLCRDWHRLLYDRITASTHHCATDWPRAVGFDLPSHYAPRSTTLPIEAASGPGIRELVGKPSHGTRPRQTGIHGHHPQLLQTGQCGAGSLAALAAAW
ncbi:MAG TPA: hypothetical protein VLJ62_33120, partial [Burkholderiaceae bacterium]|nr:hypothetical protein [Burkholderiaceae bacterium]